MNKLNMRCSAVPQSRGSLRTPWIIAVTVLAVLLLCPAKTTVYGAPAKLDSNETPLPLELQAPLLNDDFNSKPSAIDSYGNPIDTLKPIETPDGRKVVSAQGLQFEIPSYASGITDIKKPSDDLLPPFIDPIAVAVPNTDETADVENASIGELKPDQQQHQQQEESSFAPNIVVLENNELPDYLKELNDPDIAGPVDYVPRDDDNAFPLIAWDLLPPINDEPEIITKDNDTPRAVVGAADSITNNVKVGLSTTPVNTKFNGKGSVVSLNNNRQTSSETTNSGEEGSSTGTNNSEERRAISNQKNYRGNAYYTSPRTSPTTTTSTTMTTTTRKTTTTTTTPRPTTTTTRRTTTTTPPRPTTARTTPLTTTTAEPLDPADFYRLEDGDSYTLPSWLADFDDPDLDVAVAFEVPADLSEYNITISTDLLPPFEPFEDLKNIELPAPIESSTEVAKTTTTTTRPTTTTTTTKRPSITTTTLRTTTTSIRPHWVRVSPTTATQKPSTSFNSFSSNPSTGSHVAQTHNINPQTSTTTFTNQNSKLSTQFGTTTPAPHALTSHMQKQQKILSFNQNLPVDQIKSSETEADEAEPAEVAASKQPTSENVRQKVIPFLQVHNDGSYNPKPFSKNTGAYTPLTTTTTKRTTTTTTTTTTTPAPELVEANPFDSATIPTWLRDFDYPDLGPGVSYNYYPEDNDSEVNKDLVPPNKFDVRQPTESTKPSAVFVSTSPTSLNSFNIPQYNPQSASTPSSSFSSADRTVSSPSITSKVTVPFPSTSINNGDQQLNVIFVPPTTDEDYTSNTDDEDIRQSDTTADDTAVVSANPNAEQLPKSPSSNQNFPAPFDTDDSLQQQQGSTFQGGQASFPPFQGSVTSNSVTTKTTFVKSDEGKVLTNNVPSNPFLRNVQQSAKPFGFDGGIGNQPKDFGSSFGASSISASTSGNSFSSAAVGFSKAPFTDFTAASSSTSFAGGKYTGSFGGSQGVLGSGRIGSAVQTDSPVTNSLSSKFVPTGAPRPVLTQYNSNGFGNRNLEFAASNVNSQKYTGRFGGPPGVLVPIGQNQ